MRPGPQSVLLPDGRLHLHHGPIDLIIGVEGPARTACYHAARARFDTVLCGLAAELPELRKPLGDTRLTGSIARRMTLAVSPHAGVFVTPMAAVAGAVADEILAVMMAEGAPPKAYVNNGGDIAFHIEGARDFTALGPAGEIKVTAADAARGVATSGWAGRSHSLGVADAVTVLAPTAAAADVAATLIANAVDLPGHPAITRRPARDLSPDSDLGGRLVTTDVGVLSEVDIKQALSRGAVVAQNMMNNGHILQAILSLQRQTKALTFQGDLAHA